MSIGKNRRVVNTQIYADIDPLEEGTAMPGMLLQTNTKQKDPIRYFTGKIWTKEDSLLTYGSDLPLGDIFSVNYDYSEPEEEEGGTRLFPRTTQVVQLVPNLSNEYLYVQLTAQERFARYGQAARLGPIFNVGLWDSIVQDLTQRVDKQEYLDCPFDYQTPFETEEMEKLSIDNFDSLMVDLDANYNYFIKGYENRIGDAPGKVLPCMYSYISERESEYTDIDYSIYNKHISLMKKVRGIYKDVVDEKGDRIGERSSGFVDYFVAWAKAYRRTRNNPSLYTEIKDRYQNAIFSQVDADFLKGYSSKKHMFPMYMDLRFATGPGTEFSEILRETELGADLMSFILNADLEGRSSMVGSKEVLVDGEFSLANVSTRNRRWDLVNWWRTIGEDRRTDNNVIFGRNKSNETRIINSCRPQVANLLKILLAGRMRQLVRKYDRTIKGAFEDGHMAHSETLFYRVDKFRKRNPRRIMQSFFVPNSDELSVCNFIDTQVKYGVAYKYRINAYRLVFGTKYRYERVYTESRHRVPDSGDYIELPEFRIIKEPYLKLVRVPYYESKFERILDKPPVAPDVDIIPYKDVDNRLLFDLNANVGNYMLKPEIINPEEQALVSQMEQKQKVPPGSPINYVSDDPPVFFQVYRAEKLPEKYTDLAGKAYALITTKYGKSNLSNAAFIDNIIPNKKYYYVIRTKDVHGNLSYPSPVYEVEMVNADGAVYLVINIVEMEKEAFNTPIKTINKKVHISPAFVHQVIDQEGTLRHSPDRTSAWNLGQVKLGQAEENVWNKKFKFRFISKNTGRKFDLNVRFDHVFDYHRGREEEEGSS